MMSVQTPPTKNTQSDPMVTTLTAEVIDGVEKAEPQADQLSDQATGSMFSNEPQDD